MTCPVCREADARPFHSVDGRSLSICSECRHIWWNEMPEPAYLARYYSERYTKMHKQDGIQGGNREYYRGHVTELASYAGIPVTRMRLVDVGCSIPVLLEEARRARCPRALGVDYAEESRRYGRARGIEMATPEELPAFAGREFDVLRFSHTLEHLIDPLGTLRGYVELLLQPDGVVYITQPSLPCLLAGESAAPPPNAVWPEHLHFFSPLSLVKLVEEAGLRVVRFFTHTNEEKCARLWGTLMDWEFSVARMQPYRSAGDSFFHPLGLYPCYTGDGSVLVARIRAS